MAKIIGQIDSLRSLLDIFEGNSINFFKSLDDIAYFKSNYTSIVNYKRREVDDSLKTEIENSKLSLTQRINDYNHKLSEREETLLKEKEDIFSQIEHYSKTSKNFIKALYYKYKLHILKKRNDVLINDFENEKKRPYHDIEKEIAAKSENILYLENNFDKVVQKRFQNVEEPYIEAKSILDENNSIYLGAIGESKAVNVLKTLPDSYYVINGFRLDLYPPIYNKNTGDHIQSIQADHIVIGPTGVFLIETKNWSNESINNRDFYSPVEQIKRTSYALFIFLNNPDNYGDSFLSHNWGARKVSIHSIILMINSKPSQEFQYVKIVSLNEIIGYINYFKPVFSKKDVETIYTVLYELC